MTIGNTLEQFDALLDKVDRLAQERKTLLKEQERLEQEIVRLKQTIAQQVEEKEELNNKIKIIKLAQNISLDEKGSGNTSDSAELKKKINEYIREIDYCLAILNE